MFENAAAAASQDGPPRPPAGTARRWGAVKSPSTAEIIKKVADNDASLSTVDISNNASFQLKSEEYTTQLAEALQGNKHVKELRLQNCGLGDKEGKLLGAALSANSSLTLLDLQNNRINNDGGSALANGLTHNKTLVTLDLMSMAKTRWGDKCLDDFLAMFEHNITLLKINWRLESRKSFALNKMLTRNNEIDRRKKNGISYEDILPTALQTGSTVPPAPRAVLPEAEPTPPPVASPETKQDSEMTVGNKENSPPLLSDRTDDSAAQTPQAHVPESSSITPAAAAPWRRAPSDGAQASSPLKHAGGGGSGVPAAGVPKVRRAGASVLARWPPAQYQEQQT